MPTSLADPTYSSDLGNGLVRRWSTLADLPKIAHLFSMVHRDNADAPPHERSADVALILMSEGFPYQGPNDFAVVEDTSKPDLPIVCASGLWQLRWTIGDIPFTVGQPEMVNTDVEYRNRGLVRAIFEMLHARSEARGDLVQAITGISYYYRQFGYEYVLDLEGQKRVNTALIPAKKEDESEVAQLRLATLDDIPTLKQLYNQSRRDSLVWHEATDDYWRHHILCIDEAKARGRTPLTTGLYGPLYIIVDAAGESIGYTWLADKRWGSNFLVLSLELRNDINWQRVVPSLLRAIHAVALQVPATRTDSGSVTEIILQLGREHPFYGLLDDKLAPRTLPPYAWYLRVPDVLAFIRQVTLLLEKRLAESVLRGHSGELKITFYRSGMRLEFKDGKLITVEPWKVALYDDDEDAGFPPLVFLQLLFGYRSLAELKAIFPDVGASPEVTPLIDILFPKQPSNVQPLMTT